MNAIELEIMRLRLEAAGEEMGIVLQRTAWSANIKERRDFSCAVFDAEGRLIAQAAHVPVHLGSMPESVSAALAAFPELSPGQAVMLNDPYAGGTHLPDITLVEPAFFENHLIGYVASRAHHADVGGISPGSMTLSRHIDEEGVRFGPTLVTDETVETLIAGMRNPPERRADLHAQRAANRAGVSALSRLCAETSAMKVGEAMAELLAYSSRSAKAAIAAIPHGEYVAEDRMDDDGTPGGPPTAIRVAITREGEGLRVDFTQSDAQAAGCVNCPAAVTRSAVYYVLGCLMRRFVGEGVPLNAGAFEAVEVLTKPGTIVHAEYPAAVVAGNTETSQRVVDVVLSALRAALPEVVPAESCGTMSSIALGTGEWTYYETIAGGSGAGPGWDGEPGVQCHMTNTLNTPAEALELQYPLRVRRFELREGSGGPGEHKGGEGAIREIEVLAACEATLITDRRVFPPGSGSIGRNTLSGRDVGGKAHLRLKAGDRLRIETPGGSGWEKRSAERAGHSAG